MVPSRKQWESMSQRTPGNDFSDVGIIIEGWWFFKIWIMWLLQQPCCLDFVTL
ncbi:hypothetical protein FQN60_000304 [Etheostoma spectabile]|uniref:Uncharacterized protein n=1 Tax=Etheostoma spectabile TaxID=54343 RepID=A0A5J5CVJ0_9PERO|nr:hypothetical protein FQN60_000304 [Etheostoma spectabile]